MEDATDTKLRETCDRLALLLIAQPREGWESKFDEVMRREIERLAVPGAEGKCDEESSHHLSPAL